LDNLANFVALMFILHMMWSYYFNCFRKGYTLDIWHYTLIFNCFIIHIMLPFCRSDLNIFALGARLLRRTQDHVNEAYFISALGYFGILIGGALWRLELGVGLRSTASRLLELPARGSLFLLHSKRLLIFHGICAVILLAGLLAYYFSVAGFGFNFGSIIITSPALRPIAQFATFYSILIGSYAFSRFLRHRERSMMLVTLGIASGLIFFGSRNAILSIFLTSILTSFIIMGRRLRLSLLILGIFGALCLAVLLDALRSPNFSFTAVGSAFALSTFYGNSYSDTRDFAVILSYWDGTHYFGKTYLAGILAFVPRFLSPFRDKWALGVVTATLAGFKTTEHAGLRIGIFGEAYLNFGLVAVLILGILIGVSVRFIDLRMKQSADTLPASGVRIYSYFFISTIVSATANSGNASTVYSIVFIFLASWVAMKLSRTLHLGLL
jgi:hypothetical protein